MMLAGAVVPSRRGVGIGIGGDVYVAVDVCLVSMLVADADAHVGMSKLSTSVLCVLCYN